MNPDFAIILNFKLKAAKDVDVDFLVKTARNIGARAVAADSQQEEFAQACSKYIIAQVNPQTGLVLTADNAIDQIIENRRDGKSTYIDIALDAKGNLTQENAAMLDQVNQWMHLFGHALNENEPCNLSTDCGFILQNRHMHYQKYLFLKKPLPQQVIVTGLKQAPNRIEMVENRTEPAFAFENSKLIIDLTTIASGKQNWQLIRLQDHRPEDDIKETKF